MSTKLHKKVVLEDQNVRDCLTAAQQLAREGRQESNKAMERILCMFVSALAVCMPVRNGTVTWPDGEWMTEAARGFSLPESYETVQTGEDLQETPELLQIDWRNGPGHHVIKVRHCNLVPQQVEHHWHDREGIAVLESACPEMIPQAMNKIAVTYLDDMMTRTVTPVNLEELRSLLEVLTRLNCLVTLRLRHLGIDDTAADLFAAFIENTNVKNLDLAVNCFTLEGIKKISDAVKERERGPTPMSRVDLRFNRYRPSRSQVQHVHEGEVVQGTQPVVAPAAAC
eukprot:CAMPEP_0114629938 /NCGR_PEP_ID=MMETSP0168-20121206/13622_1 /TAXON_ID=95228 ORGANISM="Vannella sp., Strain DIVA3 517/6/12" /NCGR_SAMPLE_ID=MMETSP0168 /ASSEMBLY_ACC=CAM_ASM_000044 /LENGTH=282 /DNA_ID=CAMNT_0001841423 /DNA_START=43 /DNA_END=893 /DNA_ORIENTATION=-